jgi:chloramphenicol-sensitive protein RarD
MSAQSPAALRGSGVAYAFAAYFAWGFFPAYWKQLTTVPALEIIAHRVVWSFLFVAGLLTVSRRWPEFLGVVRNRRTLGALLASTALISSNWFMFIWAVNTGHVTQASLGYYINPLVNVVLARFFLGERLRGMQWAAVGLASVGVLVLAVGSGQVPWVSLYLAITFSAYGLVRKLAPVEPLTGLAVETGLAAPLGLLFLCLGPPAAAPAHDAREWLLLLGSGVATALPLLWFAIGARRLRYSTIGIIQYVAPTCQLALAVLAYGEDFTARHGLTFGLIWTAVLLYALDGVWGRTRAVSVPVEASPAGRGS